MHIRKKSSSIYLILFFFFVSISHRSEKSDVSIGEDIEEISVEMEDLNASDKVRLYLCGHAFNLVLKRFVSFCSHVLLEILLLQAVIVLSLNCHLRPLSLI